MHAADVMNVSFSDHRLIYMSLGKKAVKRGPGFWKLDASLLNNGKVREAVIELTDKKKGEYVNLDASLKWDLLKFRYSKPLPSLEEKIV